MAHSTVELEVPDILASSADAVSDALGEKMILNMGPSHPATHGVLRLILEMDGEIITKATPDIGYLHRGDEKIAENMHYNQFIPYTDRLDYLAPLANNVAYAMAVEKLMGWELPPRGQAIRVICCELARISSHLLGVGCFAMDTGAMTVFLYTFTEREKIYNLIEILTGARFTTSYTRVGGQIRDLPDAFLPGLTAFLDQFGPVIDEVDALLVTNRIFVDRTKDIGVISKEDALSYGISGPNLRGCGIDHDLRKRHPYLGYEQYDFDIPLGSVGDSYDRYLVRMAEMRQSMSILRQAIAKLPSGPIHVTDPKNYAQQQWYEGVGCEHCSGTGYRGRSAITEFLAITPSIRQMVVQRSSATEITATAIKEGMVTLRQSALAKVLAGVTTLKEINRVTFVE